MKRQPPVKDPRQLSLFASAPVAFPVAAPEGYQGVVFGVRESVRDALALGLLLSAGTYGVVNHGGRWKVDGSGRICPVGAFLLGKAARPGVCPSVAFDQLNGLVRWAVSFSAGYDGTGAGCDPEARSAGEAFRREHPPMR